VFATRTGTAVSANNVRRRALAAALTAANEQLAETGADPLPERLTPHSLRRTFLTDIEDVGPDFRIEVQRVQAIGDSNALAFVRVRSTGRASGIVTGAESTNVYDFIDGKISRIRIFLDRDEALEAVGLEG